MGRVTMNEDLQEVGKKKKKKDVRRRGTGIVIGIVTRIGIGRKVGTGTRIGIGKEAGTQKKIVIVIIEIAPGNVVGKAVREGEIEMMMMMMMIITEAETMTGDHLQSSSRATLFKVRSL